QAGVATRVVLTWRYTNAVRRFLESATRSDPIGGTGTFLSGGMIEGPFRTPWRLDRGPLLDLGPHVIDLLGAALGPIVSVRAAGELARWVGLLLEHESGVVSQATMSGHAGTDVMVSGVSLYSPDDGAVEVDCAAALDADTFGTIASEFAAAVRGDVEAAAPSASLDVGRGLYLQRIIHDAESQLLSAS
ncbi:MAG: gfo/Idh/MocA family oxidoreductase, partial [Acidobacteria bacterium]|nr:gfo/Idh/MocA family oxidoreductase [Acidobacteriota bacterium]